MHLIKIQTNSHTIQSNTLSSAQQALLAMTEYRTDMVYNDLILYSNNSTPINNQIERNVPIPFEISSNYAKPKTCSPG